MAKKSIPQLVALAPATRPLNGTEAVHCSQGGVSKGLPLNMGVVTVTGDYTVAAGISTVLVNAASAIIKLPAISYVSQKIKVIKISQSAGTVTVVRSGTNLIAPDLSTAVDLPGFGSFVELIAITTTYWYRDTLRLYNYLWTIRTSAADNSWLSVCYGNGLFVAVAITGTGNRVMTSPDGITWTIRASTADNDWHSVCYGNGLFVAVSYSGTGNRVMTNEPGTF